MSIGQLNFINIFKNSRFCQEIAEEGVSPMTSYQCSEDIPWHRVFQLTMSVNIKNRRISMLSPRLLLNRLKHSPPPISPNLLPSSFPQIEEALNSLQSASQVTKTDVGPIRHNTNLRPQQVFILFNAVVSLVLFRSQLHGPQPRGYSAPTDSPLSFPRG
jgi:hypothetical protein